MTTWQRALSTGALLLLFEGVSHASSLNVLWCDGRKPIQGVIVTCLNWEGNSNLGVADTTVGGAGVNSFLDSINVHYNSAAGRKAGYGGPDNYHAVTATTPRWTVDSVDTSLTLNGFLEFPDPGATILITLTGYLGNVNNGLTLTLFETSAFCPPGRGWCPIFETTSGWLDAKDDAVEDITIKSTGRVLYRNDDTFIGAADEAGTTPEPSSLFLFGSGVLGLVVLLRRKLF